MEGVIYALGIIATFLIVVGIHEGGHFWAARRAGVYVEKFSIGFGKPLISWHDRYGTEYCIAVIPFGGYVKMYGEDPDSAEASAREDSFSKASPLWRMFIASAGPAVNLIFAVLIYWLLLQMGFNKLAPIVGQVEAGSIAEKADLREGDLIKAVDGKKVLHWSEMQFGLIRRAGDTGNIHLLVKDDQAHRTVVLKVENWLASDNGQSPTRRLGFLPSAPKPSKAMVGQVLPDSPAHLAGLQKGDEILSIDNVTVESWTHWVELVRAAPNKTLQMTILRNEQRIESEITPREIKLKDGRVIGQVGVAGPPLNFPDDWPDEAIVQVSYGPGEAVGKAIDKVVERVVLTLRAMKKMVTGQLALENLSGPLTIGRVAGESATHGMESFLEFLAFFSLSLGVLNLLPIPVLDGGHIVMHGYEAIAKRPLPIWIQAAMMRLGLVMILSLAAIALYYDVLRVL